MKKLNTNQETVRVYVGGKWRTLRQEDIKTFVGLDMNPKNQKGGEPDDRSQK